MKISIIMMSYLGDYPNSRSNPIPKFNRAVQSVVDQTYTDWELIIISDGCELTNKEYEDNWSDNDQIKLIKTNKSSTKWPGSKRQIGLNFATGDWVCYLDSDDIFMDFRLSNFINIVDNRYDVIFDQVALNASRKSIWAPGHKKDYISCEWGSRNSKEVAYEDDEIAFLINKIPDSMEPNGTWCIFHKRDISVKWNDREKHGEDRVFVEALRSTHNHINLPISGYVICHLPGSVDI
jgi:glycosyltransferase involved in cell wall biosynthesis